jgi:hypothetical protein
MAVSYQTNARNAAVAAIAALVDGGSAAGHLEVADDNAFGSGDIGADVTLQDPAFGSPSTGVVTLAGTPLQDSTPNNAITATVWRLRDSDNNEVLRGPAATSAGGDMTLSTAAQRAVLDAITALLDGGGDIQLATDTGFGTVVATLPLNTDAFAAATGAAPATAAMNTGTLVQALSTQGGTITAARFRTSAGGEVFRCTVGEGAGDLSLPETTIPGAGIMIRITSFTLTQPATTTASDGALVCGSLTISTGIPFVVTGLTLSYPAS